MRVKRGVTTKKRHKKLTSQTKGMIKSRRSSVKKAREALMKSWSYQYRDRRNKKRDFRSLWIVRIGNFTKTQGLSYSRFMSLLKKNNVEIDRKILAELAVSEPETMKQLIERVKTDA